MDVSALQRRLQTLGHSPGPADGRMGRLTIAAIKSFQTAAGLKPDGVVGPKTMAALNLRPHAVVSAPAMVSSVCVDLVKAWEGIEDGDPATVELEPYICPAGVVTVGWGHVLLDPAGEQIRVSRHGARMALQLGRDALFRMFGKGSITRDEAKALLAMDLNRFAGGVARELAGAGRPVEQAAFDAMVSLAFNIGSAGFLSSSVRRMYAAGAVVPDGMDFAALMAFSRAGRAPVDMAQAYGAWSRGGGVWLLGLFRRRMCEAMVHRGDALADARRRSQAIRRA